MGNVNSLPIVSQVKSLVQAISGDAAGAKKTQEDFLETGVIVSQVYSAGLAINGDAEKAKKVQVSSEKRVNGSLTRFPQH